MVLAILQARMSSTRLPGKVLRPLLGEPMIGRQIERLRRAETLTRIVVATSTEAEDDAIADYCKTLGVDCHRGDLNDVLSRFLGVLDAFGLASTFVRLTADCPLADPELIDRVVGVHLRTRADYTANHQGWTWPKGLDVEVCQTAVLRAIDAEAKGADREHVTSFIYAPAQTGRFHIEAVRRETPLRYRWTVDTPEDFAFVSAVYAELYPANPAFTSADVLAWQARNPDRVLINLVAE